MEIGASNKNPKYFPRILSVAFAFMIVLGQIGVFYNISNDSSDISSQEEKVVEGRVAGVTSYGWSQSIDGPYPNEYGNNIAVDNSGNLFITGSFTGGSDFDGSSGVDSRSSAGGSDIYLTKYNANGSYSWTRTIGDNGDEYSQGVIVDGSGAVFITGRFSSSSVEFNTSGSGVSDIKNNNGSDDVFITKYNNDGSYGWTSTFGSSGIDTGRSISIDNNGYVYVVGKFSGDVDFNDSGSAVTDIHTGGGTYITKYHGSGSYGWTKSFSGDTEPYQIKVKNSNVYVTGVFSGVSVDFNGDPIGLPDYRSTNGSWDVYISRYSTGGIYQWTNTFGGSGAEYAYSLDVDNNGSVYAGGTFFSDNVDFDASGSVDSISKVVSTASRDAFLTKYNADSSYAWTKTFGGNERTGVMSVGVDSKNDVYVTGSYTSDYMDFNPSLTSEDKHINVFGNYYSAFISKYSSSGTYNWTRTMKGINSDVNPTSIVYGHNDDIYVSGWWTTHGTDSVDHNFLGTTDEVDNMTGDGTFISRYDNPNNIKSNSVAGGPDLLSQKFDYNINGISGGQIGRNKTLEIGDVNGDGVDDIVAQSFSADGIFIIFGGTHKAGSYSLNSAANYNIKLTGSCGANGNSMEIADVNGDGKGDLIIGCNNTSNVYILFSTLLDNVTDTTGNLWDITSAGSYNVRYSSLLVDALNGSSIASGDLNGDGRNDLILADPSISFGGNEGAIYVINSSLLSAVGESVGNNFPLSTSSNYSIRYQGYSTGGYQNIGFNGSLIAGDVDGDNRGDLVFSTGTGTHLYVILSNLIDDITGTGNIRPVSDPSNYSIRYDSPSSNLGHYGNLAIADTNGIGGQDLMVGSHSASNSGANSGSVYIMNSDLINNVGETTGNIFNLSSGGNFNIRIDGAGANHQLGWGNGIKYGDINEDGDDDLVVSSSQVNKLHILFSTLIDDFSGTGNILNLSTTSNYSAFLEEPNYSTSWGYSSVGAIELEDLDRDGADDLVIADSSADTNGVNSGAIWVFDSSTFESMGSTTGNYRIASHYPVNYSRRFDGSVGEMITGQGSFGIGDMNNDRINDLAIISGTSNSIYVKYGGAVIGSLPSRFSVELLSDPDVDLTEDHQSGTQTVRLNFDGNGIADIETDFSGGNDIAWNDISAEVHIANGIAVINNLTEADKTADTHTMYVPSVDGDNAVYICPNATTLAEVILDCPDGYILNQNSSRVSSTMIDGIPSWRINGLTGTGAMSYNDGTTTPTPSPTPSTGTGGIIPTVIVTPPSIEGITSGELLPPDSELANSSSSSGSYRGGSGTSEPGFEIIIENVLVEEGREEAEIVICWTANIEGLGKVNYGPEGNLVSVSKELILFTDKEACVSLKDLKGRTEYDFEIVVTSEEYGSATKIGVFTVTNAGDLEDVIIVEETIPITEDLTEEGSAFDNSVLGTFGKRPQPLTLLPIILLFALNIFIYPGLLKKAIPWIKFSKKNTWGYLYNAITGKPVPLVTVTRLGKGNGNEDTISGLDGRIGFAGPEIGTNNFNVNDPEYFVRTSSIDIVQGQTKIEMDLGLVEQTYYNTPELLKEKIKPMIKLKLGFINIIILAIGIVLALFATVRFPSVFNILVILILLMQVGMALIVKSMWAVEVVEERDLPYIPGVNDYEFDEDEDDE